MKVNRKNTPKMAVRRYPEWEFQKLERRERNIERAKFTVVLMILWVIAVGVWEILR